MKTSAGQISRSLAAKLMIALGLLIIIGGGASWYFLIDAGAKGLMNDAVRHTASYSALVKKSTRYSMLTYDREAIQRTIEDIGSARDIERIRIFDKKGKVFYSSRRDETGQQVSRTAKACAGCHANPERPSETLAGAGQWVVYTGKEGHRVLTFIEPIYNEPLCYTSACHIHPQNQKVLGILESDFSLESLDESILKQERTITFYAIALMLFSSIVLYFVHRKFILKPVSTLSKAMEKVAAGDLTQTVTIASRDEIGLLSKTFNAMTKDLEIAKERMDQWTQTLETEIAKKTGELKKSQDKLIQAEKLAALGRLTSDVAHEIRNPLTALGGFANRLHKIATGTKEKEYSSVIVTEVEKLEKILRDVLTFSRDARLHLQRNNLRETILEVFEMYRSFCAEQSIDLTVEIAEDLPTLLLDRDQVRQALSNLVTNAIDAMPDGGVMTITAGEKEMFEVPFVFVKVSDTGQGIAEDKLPLIFEPFFSTKEIGHGTGLGLSITRKIIEEHGGFIRAESSPGKGSAFTLFFPYQSEETSLRIPCWVYMKCGRDKDATMKCPSYPNFGRICWVVAGTFCEGKVHGAFAQKYEDCKKCDFFLKVSRGEI